MGRGRGPCALAGLPSAASPCHRESVRSLQLHLWVCLFLLPVLSLCASRVSKLCFGSAHRWGQCVFLAHEAPALGCCVPFRHGSSLIICSAGDCPVFTQPLRPVSSLPDFRFLLPAVCSGIVWFVGKLQKQSRAPRPPKHTHTRRKTSVSSPLAPYGPGALAVAVCCSVTGASAGAQQGRTYLWGQRATRLDTWHAGPRAAFLARPPVALAVCSPGRVRALLLVPPRDPG